MKRQLTDYSAANGIEALLKNTDVNPAGIEQRWLAWQCQMLASCTSATLVNYPPEKSGNLEVLASWPTQRVDPDLISLMPEFDSDQKHTSHAKAFQNQDCVEDFISCPITNKTKSMMLLVKSEHRPASQRQAMIHLLQWGGNCLALLQNEQKVARNSYSLMESIFSSDNIELCLMELCGELQSQTKCLSVCFLGEYRSKSLITSYPAQQILENSDLSLQLKKLKDESFAQESVIYFPSIDKQDCFKREHQRYSQRKQCAICTVPMFYEDKRLGVLLFEKEEPFEPKEIKLISKKLEALSKPIANRLIVQSPRKTKGRKLIDYLSHKKTVAVICAFLVFVILGGFFEADFEVKAIAEVEGKNKQLIVAPMMGT